MPTTVRVMEELALFVATQRDCLLDRGVRRPGPLPSNE
jgi:hypothetical protein